MRLYIFFSVYTSFIYSQRWDTEYRMKFLTEIFFIATNFQIFHNPTRSGIVDSHLDNFWP